jgi:hypothetical protein
MKKLYFNLMLMASFVLLFTSCSSRYKFVTEGLPEKDSSYVVTTSGKRVDATDIVVKPNKLTVDKQIYSLDSLTAIKSKKMYFAVNDGKLHLADMYGKINLLYTLSYGTSYTPGYAGGGGSMGGMSGSHGSYQTTVTKTLYLQKQGSTDVDKAKHSVVISYLSDNEEALAKVRGSYAWTYVGYAGWVTAATGLILCFATAAKNANTDSPGKSLGLPLSLLGGGFVGFAVSSSISNHKFKKAFKIYNR